MAILDTTSALELRQGRVVTQTITRPFTTIIAVVTLGDGPTSPPPALGSSMPTTTTTATPAAPPGPASGGSAPSSSITQQQLVGIILGTLLGVLFLVVTIWCTLSWARRRSQEAEYILEEDEYMMREAEVMAEMEEMRRTQAWDRAKAAAATPSTSTWTAVPPPVAFPPTPRHTPYRQTRHPQFRGTWRYP
jgi:type IV secretory pathway VirB2 component (pilin)